MEDKIDCNHLKLCLEENKFFNIFSNKIIGLKHKFILISNNYA